MPHFLYTCDRDEMWLTTKCKAYTKVELANSLGKRREGSMDFDETF